MFICLLDVGWWFDVGLDSVNSVVLFEFIKLNKFGV